MRDQIMFKILSCKRHKHSYFRDILVNFYKEATEIDPQIRALAAQARRPVFVSK